MKNTTLKYGLIGSLIICALMVINMKLMLNSMAYSTAEILGYVSMLLGFSMIYLAIRRVRDKDLGGKISFGRAFRVGLLISLMVSVVYVVTWMLFVSIQGDGFLDLFFDRMLEEIKNSGEPKHVIEAQVKQMHESRELYQKPTVQAIVSFLEIFPPGLLVSLICAAILRKK